MKFTAETINAIKAHAREEYPREAVGAVVCGQYVPMLNLSPHPERHVKADAAELAKFSRSGGLQAIVHSHPDGPQYPSRADMTSQIQWGCAFGIIALTKEVTDEPFFWGGTTPMPPLIGRPFRHGVTDCFALIRDWYRIERGVTVPDFPRDWGWWDQGENMYEKHFKDCGCIELTGGEEIEEGDVFLASLVAAPDKKTQRVKDNPLNHAGIYLGKKTGQILHHYNQRRDGYGYDPNSPSKRHNIVAFNHSHKIYKWLRFVGLPK